MDQLMRGREALLSMLAVRRPHGSKSERRWIKQWLEPLGVNADAFGNLWLRIGDEPVLWSSHTDTVHTMGGTQRIAFDPVSGRIDLADDEKQSNCLGADDTGGVWLMREMILDRKPGIYVFHRGEEQGCLGSSWIARELPALLEPIKWAIAFDRKGYDSVITYQMDRSCSDRFARTLADQLGGSFAPDDTGIYTDTASYVGLIPECTNVSIGYHHCHTTNEWLNWRHLEWLRGRVMEIDTSLLPVVRDPTEKPDWDQSIIHDQPARPRSDYSELVHLVRSNPEAVADFLEGWGVTSGELYEAMEQAGVVVEY